MRFCKSAICGKIPSLNALFNFGSEEFIKFINPTRKRLTQKVSFLRL